MVHLRETEKGAVVIDDRHAPLIIASFFGEIDLTLGRWYEARNAQVIVGEFRRGRRVVNISDATRSNNPNAEMRKFWAGLTERHAASLQEKIIFSGVVVTNRLMRGALTAVGWLSPKLSTLQIYPSMQAAITASVAALAEAGTPPDVSCSHYRLPPEAAHLIAMPAAKGA